MDNQQSVYRQQLHWKLEQLKTEIRDAQAEIQKATEVVAGKQQQVENVLKLLEADGEAIDRTELDGIIPISLWEVAAKFLRENKRPMHYKALTEAIQKKGHKIQGQNPQATIIALLHRRKDEFVRLDEGVWGLREWNLPPSKDAPPKSRKGKRRVRRKSR